jgi:hypothetical protein
METEEINFGFTWSKKSIKPVWTQAYILSDENIKWIKNGKVQFEYPWEMLVKMEYDSIAFNDKKKYTIQVLFQREGLFEKIIKRWGILYPDKCVENMYRQIKYAKWIIIILMFLTAVFYGAIQLNPLGVKSPVEPNFTIIILLAFAAQYVMYYRLKKKLMKLISEVLVD